jgi:NADH:ubiquinone oxidoreductase subunit K
LPLEPEAVLQCERLVWQQKAEHQTLVLLAESVALVPMGLGLPVLVHQMGELRSQYMYLTVVVCQEVEVRIGAVLLLLYYRKQAIHHDLLWIQQAVKVGQQQQELRQRVVGGQIEGYPVS